MSQNTDDDGGSKYGGEKNAAGVPEDPKGIMDIYTPIKALSTFNYDWRIKARLIKKYERKCWKNARSEGYLLNIELMDQHGTQIQCTFFKDACDQFEHIMTEGNIYLMSNG